MPWNCEHDAAVACAWDRHRSLAGQETLIEHDMSTLAERDDRGRVEVIASP